jgi:hypothetical protein
MIRGVAHDFKENLLRARLCASQSPDTQFENRKGTQIMRQIFVYALMFVIASSIFFVVGKERQHEEKGGAQATDSKQANDQIEVNTDRFSGVTTVQLKPQVILDKPDHQLTIEIKTKLGEKGQLDFEKDDVAAEIRFRSMYKESVDFGDQELHLLIDGKPLNHGKISGGDAEATDEDVRKQRGFKLSTFFVAIFNRSELEQIGKAKKIEMRLGPIEPTFSQSVVSSLRDYANQVLAQHKIARERKQ